MKFTVAANRARPDHRSARLQTAKDKLAEVTELKEAVRQGQVSVAAASEVAHEGVGGDGGGSVNGDRAEFSQLPEGFQIRSGHLH